MDGEQQPIAVWRKARDYVIGKCISVDRPISYARFQTLPAPWSTPDDPGSAEPTIIKAEPGISGV